MACAPDSAAAAAPAASSANNPTLSPILRIIVFLLAMSSRLPVGRPVRLQPDGTIGQKAERRLYALPANRPGSSAERHRTIGPFADQAVSQTFPKLLARSGGQRGDMRGGRPLPLQER